MWFNKRCVEGFCMLREDQEMSALRFVVFFLQCQKCVDLLQRPPLH